MHSPYDSARHHRIAPLVCLALCLAASAVAAPTPRVHMAGDSTMADKKDTPPNLERGWGQMLKDFAVAPDIIVNHAQNGRSTVSFIAEGRWTKLLEGVAPGDFVIVQFGHNDEKQQDPKRYAAPRGLYRENLLRFIRDVRERKAEPILATPICRRKFDTKGQLVDTHGDYPAAVRDVAAEAKVPLLDMTESTKRLFTRLGPEESKKLMMHVPAGKYPELPKGLQDDTHLNAEGGRVIARLAIEEMRAKRLPVAALFKD